MGLRNGPPRLAGGGGTVNPDTLRGISNAQFFDYLGVRLNADKAEGKVQNAVGGFKDALRGDK